MLIKSNLLIISETDLAWLAGIIDGEGCIGFTTTRTQKGNIAFQPAIRIGNTDKSLIQKASQIFKAYSKNKVDYGKVTRKTIGKDGCQRKDYFEISLKRMEDVKNLLVDLLPFLTAKRDLAEEFIGYCKHRIPNMKRDKMLRSYDDWETNFIAEYHTGKMIKAGVSAAKT